MCIKTSQQGYTVIIQYKKRDGLYFIVYSPSEPSLILHRYAPAVEHEYKVELIISQMQFRNLNPNVIRLNLQVDFPNNLPSRHTTYQVLRKRKIFVFVGILRGMLMEGCLYVTLYPPEWNWDKPLYVGTWMLGHTLDFIKPGFT